MLQTSTKGGAPSVMMLITGSNHGKHER